jgi:hypothetical protein
LRIVNAVVELRDDIQQMADNAAKLARRLFSGNLRRARRRAASSCARYQTALAIRQHSALLALARPFQRSHKSASCSSTSADPARHSAAYSAARAKPDI